MIFEEYYKKYRIFVKIRGEINDLEIEKIKLDNMVDIQAVPPKESIGTGSKVDTMLIYTAKKEELETKLFRKKNLIKEIRSQLREKEEELRCSNNILDKVYLYKYVEKLKWYEICRKIGYEKTKTYDFINEVDEILSKIRIAEKKEKK